MEKIIKMAEEEFEKMQKYLDTLDATGSSRYTQEERLKLVHAMAEFCRVNTPREYPENKT